MEISLEEEIRLLNELKARTDDEASQFAYSKITLLLKDWETQVAKNADLSERFKVHFEELKKDNRVLREQVKQLLELYKPQAAAKDPNQFVGDNDHGNEVDHLYWKGEAMGLTDQLNEARKKIIDLELEIQDNADHADIREGKIDSLIDTNKILQEERNEAQRLYCQLMVESKSIFRRVNGENVVVVDPADIATMKGWNCFDEQ